MTELHTSEAKTWNPVADDEHLRQLALSFAVEPGRTRADVLATAKEYLAFLQGDGDKQPPFDGTPGNEGVFE